MPSSPADRLHEPPRLRLPGDGGGHCHPANAASRPLTSFAPPPQAKLGRTRFSPEAALRQCTPWWIPCPTIAFINVSKGVRSAVPRRLFLTAHAAHPTFVSRAPYLAHNLSGFPQLRIFHQVPLLQHLCNPSCTVPADRPAEALHLTDRNDPQTCFPCRVLQSFELLRGLPRWYRSPSGPLDCVPWRRLPKDSLLFSRAHVLGNSPSVSMVCSTTLHTF